jgi:hypothetical protein
VLKAEEQAPQDLAPESAAAGVVAAVKASNRLRLEGQWKWIEAGSRRRVGKLLSRSAGATWGLCKVWNAGQRVCHVDLNAQARWQELVVRCLGGLAVLCQGVMVAGQTE